MTPAQLATLRTAIQAETDPAFVTFRNEGATGAMADWFNVPHASFVCWKSRVSRHDIIANTSDEGTVFTWAGAGYITRSQGERDAFREMFNSLGTVNPSQTNIQQAFADIFSGAGNAALNRAHVQAMSKRKATRGERLFATGTGTTASPGTLTFEGNVSNDDVVQALA